MAQYEKQMHARLDVTRCDNVIIRDVIGINSMIILNIPIKYRKSTMAVK